ncbi:histone H1.2-like [Eupeodes corollae]|uniref:histone H1.2-like n=1 Tax=Eupeodes corollae TaxID=290404 RepID=UPI002492AE86|nr:histone H1.2-like [Eupeodes corollae]
MDELIPISSTPKKQRSYHHHPTTRVMVDDAVKVLNKCSYRAIKQYIVAKYLVDLRYLLKRIKSYIRESVANGKFIQITGHGLNGSFRLSAAARRNPKKFFIRQRKIMTRKDKQNKLNKKPTTFLMEPIIHRRTSITINSIKRRLSRSSGSLRSPRPRLVKNENQSSFQSNDTNNNDLPSTSSDAIDKLKRNMRNCCKLSHMC